MDEEAHHCHFPTSTRKNAAESSFATLKVCCGHSVDLTNDDDLEQTIEKVRTAWAILLHSYIRQESIFFAILFGPAPCENTTTTSFDTTFIETQDLTSVLQYYLPEKLAASNRQPVKQHHFTGQEMSAHRINTAILTSSQSLDWTGNKAGVENSEAPLGGEVSNGYFDLILSLSNPLDLCEMKILYRQSCISAKYVAAIARSFSSILEVVVSQNTSHVDIVDLVNDSDKKMVMGWSSVVLHEEINCLHTLVEQSVRAKPFQEAVCAWDGSLTYAELDLLSSNVAKTLISAGVGPGVYVPFAFEKSMWTVVATLGILKAGGAFVPLDPLHPKARLQEIIKITNAQIVVTSELHAITFVDLVETVINVSSSWPGKVQWDGSESEVLSVVKSSDPVFVLFTSGSTGQPKGMIHEHGPICSHTIAHGKAMGFRNARVLQFAAHTFDVAIMDIFTTLVFGGCVCIPSEEDRKNDLIRTMNNMGITLAILMPQLARLIQPSDVPTLRTLAVGGEALPQDCIDLWVDNVSFIQIYGPAEVGICLLMTMSHEDYPESVGYPPQNCACWLVDPNDPNRLVPVGAVGELVVAGPSLARGYLNNEAKTRSSFLDRLAWAETLAPEHERFYITGDLLRFNTDFFDGRFDFVGRKDSQLKVRSQRVEPGEIEYHLGRIPGLSTSVVVRPEVGSFAGQLVAVVRMRHASGLTTRAQGISVSPCQCLSLKSIKYHLSKGLPQYMIPTAHVEIDNFPVTPSHKIDRRAIKLWLESLTMPDLISSMPVTLDLDIQPLHTHEKIATELSHKIAGIVAARDITKRQMLESRNFCFQKTGIDSVQIMSLSLFIQRRFEVKISMHVLLNTRTTVRDLATFIEQYKQPSLVPNMASAHQINISVEAREADEVLFHGLNVSQQPMQVPVRNILLTGGTGYLGFAILQRLLQNTDKSIFLLVRCPSEAAGEKHITDKATKLGWWKESYAERIRVWKGDLEEANLGLNTAQKHQLVCAGSDTGKAIHGIIHNGAKVHYSSSYETLKAANVGSTIELLRLTAQSPAISTFVFVSGGRKPSSSTSELVLTAAAEIEELDDANGYTQTKFVAEDLVRRCVDRPEFQSKRFSTIKPGYIVGSREEGISNQSDFIWRLVAGCVEIGAYNRDESENWLFMTSADHVASHVVSSLVDDSAGSGDVRQVRGGLRFVELWKVMSDFGYHLKGLPCCEWMERLKDAVWLKGEGHLLFPLLDVLEKEGRCLGSKSVPSGDDSAEMMEVVKSNVKHLIDVGFFPKPMVMG